MSQTAVTLAHRVFTVPGLLLVLVPVAFYFAYADTFKELWHYWNEGQNWQYLIPIAFLYMLWDRKELFSELEVRPSILWGTLLLVFSVSVLIAGQISYTHTLRELAVVFTVFSLVLLLFGRQYIVALFWPLVYLILMTSLPTDLLARSSDTLQLISATVGANLLESIGYAVYREGNVLPLPHITLLVAEECSGLNQLMSAIALGIPIAFTMVDTWWNRITILLLSCVFGIMANWLRVVLIAIWHYDSAKASIHGPQEIYQLPFIFLVGVFLTFVIALAMADKQKPVQLGMPSGQRVTGTALGANRIAPLIAIAVLALAAVYLNTWHIRPVYLQQDLAQFPRSIAGFEGKPITELGTPFHSGLAQQELVVSYTNPAGATVNIFIGYFQSQDAEHELVDYRYNWLHEGAQAVEVPTGASPVRMKMNRVQRNTGTETAFFVYRINGRSLVDLKRVKLASLVDALLYRRSNGAIVVALFDKANDKLSADEQAFLAEFLMETQARL